jgi:hypothetical protein
LTFHAEYAGPISLNILNAANLMRSHRRDPTALILSFLLAGNVKVVVNGVHYELRKTESGYKIYMNNEPAPILDEHEMLLYELLFKRWSVWDFSYRLGSFQYREKVKNDAMHYLNNYITINSGWGIVALRNLRIKYLQDLQVTSEQIKSILGIQDYWFPVPKRNDVLKSLVARSISLKI